MRRLLMGLALAILATGTASADEKAEAAVKKAIEGHGGAEALNKLKATRFVMKGDISIIGMDLEFTGKASFMLPNKYRMEMNSEIMGQKMTITQVVNGDKIKSIVKVGDMTIPEDEEQKKELKFAAIMQEAQQLTPLLDAKKFKIVAGDDVEVMGKKTSVVVVTPTAMDRELKLFIDKTTGLILKTAHKGIGPGEAGTPVEVLEESYMSEYKKVSGIQVAMKMEVKHDDKKFMTVNVSDYEALEKIDEKEFTIDD